ncbi:MAG TPA: divalent metal cation transporter [Candidatus Hydrogenedentes bacterium]|nr:divalent metal cation transporter [Candidatus Hydrogenedentota bacterium]HPG68477.1 divalent metal cation transporter [Candidatus Hydrogenedentota bacterium]
MAERRSILRRLGPGLITASVVLGPGSIVSSSRAGAERGYDLLWVMAMASLFMAVYTSMGARLGCALGKTSPLQHLPRPLAAIIGFSAFLVCGGFQFGNNIGVAVAVSNVTSTPTWIWPIAFTALSLVFLFTAKHLYVMLERLMMALVAVMIVAFFGNLFWTGMSPSGIVSGLVPRLREGNSVVGRAMLATTFSAVAALYQAYLVQAKQWKREDVRMAIGDAWIGIAVLGLISTVIMIGAAQTLHGSGKDFASIGELAQTLRGALGNAAVWVFCAGLAAASFSSFIVNALVGGGMLADGLGLDRSFGGPYTKGLTALVMLIGCGVAVATLKFGTGSTTSLLLAQGATLLAAPLSALLLFVLTSREKTMGDLKNGPVVMALGAIGLVIILWLGFGTAAKLAEKLLGT